MSKQDQISASSKAVKDAENTWFNFLKASKICGVAIGITLILMALLLV